MPLSSASIDIGRHPVVGVREIWSEILGVDVVADDHLFDFGGDSMDAIRILGRVRERFGIAVDVAAFLRHPTARFLAESIANQPPIERAATVVPKSRPTRFPLTPAQTRLWFLDSWIRDRHVYNVSRLLRVDGEVEADGLRRAWEALIDRHEILRTRLISTDGVPFQEPLARVPVAFEVHSFPDSTDEAEIVREACALAAVPFDLAKASLARCTLFHAGRRSWILLVLHHVVTDGWSMGVIVGELSESYAASCERRKAELPPIRTHYGDYALSRKSEPISGSSLDWWRLHLADLPAPFDLPMARKRPRVPTFRGSVHRFELSADDRDGIDGLCRAGRLTRAQLLLSLFAVLIHRLTRAEDLLIGMPLALRSGEGTQEMIGLLVQTVVVRVRLKPDHSFAAVLAHVREVLRETLAHGEVPLETLIEELRPVRDPARPPFFELAFVYQNHPGLPDRFAEMPLTALPIHNGTSMFDLRLVVEPAVGETPSPLWIEYNRDLFDPVVVDRMAGHYSTLVEACVADPDRAIAAPCLLGDAERRQIVEEWNDTDSAEEPACIHSLFEKQARTRPSAIAIVTATETWTYGELDARSAAIARFLLTDGLIPGSFVGVCLSRTPDMVAAVLGVLRAGGAYVPLDPAYPDERLRFMARDCRTGTILVSKATRDRLDGEDARLVDIDRIGDGDGLLEVLVRPSDRCYAIYTSGSTGRPKGVVLTHAAVTNTLRWVNDTFGVGPTDRVLFVTSLSFDLSVYDIFGTLAAGASIRIADERDVREPARLMRILRTEPITIWDSAPAAMQALMPFAPTGMRRLRGGDRLRLVLLSGDWIGVTLPDAIRSAFPMSQVVSLGGATEAAVWSNWFPVGIVDPSWTSIPYGRPIRNCRYRILDAAMNPQPMGVPGELYIGGACLAEGYLHRPELTAERFVADPFRPGQRLYRTGDLARYFPDGSGNIEFLGRLDHQVKIRGYRVELGEIEAALENLGGVRRAVVTSPTDGPGERYLVAFLVGDGRSLNAADLSARLGETLPTHMIPSEYVVLDEMPLTPSRKIDRAALVPPGRAGRTVPSEVRGYVAPKNDTELALQAIWEEVLGVSPISVTDRFYDLGGHSLKAAILMSRIQSQLGHALPLELLLTAPTIRALALPLQDLPQLTGGALVPLQPRGSRTPLFLTTGAGGHVFTFHRLARVLGDDQPTFGLKAYGVCGTEKPPDDFETIASRYLGEIVAERPMGPYRLGGYSVGGEIAFELCRQMERAGHVVERLYIFDSYAPGYWREQTWGRWLTARVRRLFRQRWKGMRIRYRDICQRRSSSSSSRSMDAHRSPDVDPAMRAVFRAVWDGLARAREKYRPQGRIAAPISLICSGGGPEPCWFGWPDPRRGWDERTRGSVTVHYVAGDHGEVFAEANLADLARIVGPVAGETIVEYNRPDANSHP